MKNKTTISVLSILIAIVAIAAVSIRPTPLRFQTPKGWPKPASNIFSKNPLTEEGFQLGRKLFYDANLSKDGNISCASCHQQFAAFANFDHDLSHGVNNSFTTRNAPGLFNLAWSNEFHWDGGVNHIEVQPLSPLTLPNEMGESLDSIIYKLNKDKEYPVLFKQAFGSSKITGEKMLKAFAQFTGSLVSADSKYDKVKRGEATFTRFEANGYALFKRNCSGCHKEPLFTDNTYRNNGLSLNRLNDAGRMQITGKTNDSLKFRVPSLRNVQVTYPYMHDGGIFSVPQVLDHYLKLDTTLASLDPSLKKRIVLSPREKNEIVYFLYTLTDSTFLKDARFGPPPTAEIKNVHPH